MDGEKEKNVLNFLVSAHYMYPELRIGQLVCCAAAATQWQSDDVFYIPDERLADGLKKMINKVKE